MGDHSQIEWTDATWNPIVGCSRVSAGCDGCYAVSSTWRLGSNPNPLIGPVNVGLVAKDDAGHLDWTGEMRVVEHQLDQPLRWTRPRRIFVNSRSDLFHPKLSVADIARVFAVMALAPQHTFQVLTKRPQRMAEVLARIGEGCPEHFVLEEAIAACVDLMGARGQKVPLSDEWSWPLPNVWLGTSIESNRYAFRADHLRRTPAAVRWVSAEPLLGPLNELDLTGIDWLVVGGESKQPGHQPRPMHPDWVDDLRDRCRRGHHPRYAEGAHPHCTEGCAGECHPENRLPGPAFFFKQWGHWGPFPPVGPDGAYQHDAVDNATVLTDGQFFIGWDAWKAAATRNSRLTHLSPTAMYAVGKKAAGDLIDGIQYHEYPNT